jgi:quercetin dioxygenase-like cupin family protein
MKTKLSEKIEDERGYIQDLVTNQKIDAVTIVTMRKGSQRGNHYHKLTTQWTYVLSGSVKLASSEVDSEKIDFEILMAGDLALSAPSVSHGLLAMDDAEILIITKGPRAGFDYETDTYRLEESLFQ